jgi:hypothetical protein
MEGEVPIMTDPKERRKHPRLPLHLSVAKLVDFKCDGLDQPTPAILVDLSAGGLAMIAFALPSIAKNVTFRLQLPGVVDAQLHGRIVRADKKGETYKVAVAFTEYQEKWANLVNKLIKSYEECDYRHAILGGAPSCSKKCAYHSLLEPDEKVRASRKTIHA